MSQVPPTPVVELSEAAVDALIERVEQAIAHHLALSVEDLQLLLTALLTLAHRHERLAENDMTLHKLRKLAGIVQRSEKLKHLTGAGAPSGENKPPRPPKAPPTPPAPPPEPVIHQHAQRRQAKASCRRACEPVANAVQPVVRCLIEQAARAHHYHLDDTTNRILNQSSMPKPDRKTGQLKTRSGIFTSGVVATLAGGQPCILFQTHIGHAGEWIDQILAPRPPDLPQPMIMCDALNRNFPSQCEFHKTLCNAHARREFADVFEHFPDQVTGVLEDYGRIWEHEKYGQKHGLSPPQRLAYHQQHSLPVMEQLRDWGQQPLDSGEVEANSGLGQAISYFLRHFEGLTAFAMAA